jgi:hypothetical protein
VCVCVCVCANMSLHALTCPYIRSHVLVRTYLPLYVYMCTQAYIHLQTLTCPCVFTCAYVPLRVYVRLRALACADAVALSIPTSPEEGLMIPGKCVF